MQGVWSKELLARQVWALAYTLPAEVAPRGYVAHRATVRWAHRLTREALTMDWIVDALNTGLGDVAHRTWTAVELDTDDRYVRFLHNGLEVGEVEWQPTVRRASRDLLTGRIVAALNVEREHGWTCPEPTPPTRYVTADHDFATGEDIEPREVAA